MSRALLVLNRDTIASDDINQVVFLKWWWSNGNVGDAARIRGRFDNIVWIMAQG